MCVVTIRPARAGDAERIFELARAMATSFTPTARSFGATLSDLLRVPDARVLVAQARPGSVDGYLLGFVHPTFFADGPVAWVEEVGVDVGAERLGLGRALMAEFERWAADRQARLVALATRRADAFYEALGYERSAAYFRKLLP